MSIGDRIREVRKKQGVSQTVFATALGVSRSAIRAYELNEREPSSSFLLRLNQEWSIDSTWLLTGKGAATSDDGRKFIADAVVAVRTFAILEHLEIEPELEARAVLLLKEYFDGGGEKESNFVKKILEAAL